jgi:hypothetical protein
MVLQNQSNTNTKPNLKIKKDLKNLNVNGVISSFSSSCLPKPTYTNFLQLKCQFALNKIQNFGQYKENKKK